VVTIDELVVADAPEAWRALGFAVEGEQCAVGTTRVRLEGPGAGRGILSWSLRAPEAPLDGLPTASRRAPEVPLDGLPTTASRRPPPAPAAHPNGTTHLDHVVVSSPDFDRTAAAFAGAGLDLRRVREAGDPQRPFRQGFYRLGEVILELVEDRGGGPGPARFWGLVFVTPALDALPEGLVKAPRDAVQPGRRIATVRREAGLSAAAAFMSPPPA